MLYITCHCHSKYTLVSNQYVQRYPIFWLHVDYAVWSRHSRGNCNKDLDFDTQTSERQTKRKNQMVLSSFDVSNFRRQMRSGDTCNEVLMQTEIRPTGF